MKKILCVGGCVIDFLLITDVPLIEFEDKKFLGIEYSSKSFANDFKINEGGSATNVALNLKALGMNTALLAVIGNDFLGNYLFEKIKTSGVDTSHLIKTNDGNTGTSVIIRSPKYEDRGMITYKGANDLLNENHIDEKFIKDFDYLIWCSLTSENALKTIDKLISFFRNRKNPRTVIAAPSSSVIKKFPEIVLKLIKHSHIFTANLEEAQFLLQQKDLSWVDCAKEFLKFGLEFVSISNGEHGAIIGNKGSLIKVVPPSVVVKDTSGVGDAFVAGLIYGLITNKNVPDSGKIGTLMAYSKLQGYGTRDGIPNINKIQNLLNDVGSKIKIIELNE